MSDFVRSASGRRWLMAGVAALAGVSSALAQPDAGNEPLPPQPDGSLALKPLDSAEGPSPFGFGAIDYTLRGYSSYEFSSDLKGDPGQVSVFRAGALFRADMPVNRNTMLRLTAGSEYVNFDFQNDEILGPGSPTPVEELSNYRLGLGIEQVIAGDWAWTGRVNARDGIEGGANFADGLAGDISGGVLYEVRPGVRIGVGMTVFFRIEDHTQFIPIPLIVAQWKLNEHWSLNMDVPDGINFKYEPNQNVAISIGATLIWQDYRLSSNNPTPNGVFREASIPLMVTADWRFAEAWTAEFGIGSNLYQRLDINDSDGNDVADVTTQFAPMMMLGLRWAF